VQDKDFRQSHWFDYYCRRLRMKSRSPVTPRPTLLWFRLDLRLADNPALQAAIQFVGPVIPVFIHTPDEEAHGNRVPARDADCTSRFGNAKQ
jgi:hypothetical protein